MHIVRIGYQGIEGSNSEEAAKKIAGRLGIKEYLLVPLITSRNVVGELTKGKIDYGVIAVRNTIGGVVQESKEALKNERLVLVSVVTTPIHHCLFKKDNSIKNKEINKVVSHVQALKQSEINLQRILPGVKTEEIEDTAIGARRLGSGELGDNVGVICRKNAGEIYGLELIKENIEDNKENFTEFRMYERGMKMEGLYDYRKATEIETMDFLRGIRSDEQLNLASRVMTVDPYRLEKVIYKDRGNSYGEEIVVNLEDFNSNVSANGEVDREYYEDKDFRIVI